MFLFCFDCRRLSNRDETRDLEVLLRYRLQYKLLKHKNHKPSRTIPFVTVFVTTVYRLVQVYITFVFVTYCKQNVCEVTVNGIILLVYEFALPSKNRIII